LADQCPLTRRPSSAACPIDESPVQLDHLNSYEVNGRSSAAAVAVVLTLIVVALFPPVVVVLLIGMSIALAWWGGVVYEGANGASSRSSPCASRRLWSCLPWQRFSPSRPSTTATARRTAARSRSRTHHLPSLAGVASGGGRDCPGQGRFAPWSSGRLEGRVQAPEKYPT
jgi:hypothetical protein